MRTGVMWGKDAREMQDRDRQPKGNESGESGSNDYIISVINADEVSTCLSHYQQH
jgi:hypothetical protein